MSKVRMEMEVEYVRREMVVFEAELGDGMSTAGMDPVAGRLLRAVQYHMHHGKNLLLREAPRLLGWRVLDKECTCSQYTDDHAHETRYDDRAGRCARCQCSCPPPPVATIVWGGK